MASNDTLLVLRPNQVEQAASNYAQLDVRNNRPCLNFDGATAWTAHFGLHMPRNYSGGGITATVLWVPLTGTSGGVTWAGCFERNAPDADSASADSFSSEQSASSTVTTNTLYKTTSIAFTNAQIDGIAPGEFFRFRLRRDVAHASDTMSGSMAQVFMIELRET